MITALMIRLQNGSLRTQKGEFFKGMTIDFPNSSTTKNSRNYVKKMKKLEVSRDRMWNVHTVLNIE
jgi:hypothetical protein